MKISEAFQKLLEDLVSGGALTEEAKNALYSEVQKKLQESAEVESEELEAKFKQALEAASSELFDKFRTELEATKDSSAEAEDGKDEGVSIADAFKQFLATLPKHNVVAFNAMTDSFTDEQKTNFEVFLSGQFGALDIEADKGEEPAPEDGENEEAKELEAEVTEAVGILDKLCNGICESSEVPNDLVELAKKLLSEAPSDRIAALNKKYEREYAKLLKKRIKEMGAENRTFKLTGGITGKAKRTNDLGRVLKGVRQELYLRESQLAELNSQLAEAKASRRMAEAEKRDLSERISQISSDNDSLSESLNKMKKENLQLTESVKNVESRLQLNEAKAFLVEKTATLAPRMKAHLLAEFKGKNLEFIKSNLNEAIDAFNEQERQLAESLRNRSSIKPSQLISEAAESDKENADEESDPLVTSLMESILKGR